MIEVKKVNELLDAIIELKDTLSWEKLVVDGIYKANLPNGDYFMIDSGDSEDNLMFGNKYQLCFGKWVISSVDYPKIYDLVKIADKYLQDKEDEEAEQYFKELKSLVDECLEEKNDTPKLPFNYDEEKERFIFVMNKCFVGINKICSLYFGAKRDDDWQWAFMLDNSSLSVDSFDKLFSDLVLNHFNEGTEDVTNKTTKYNLLLAENMRYMLQPSIFKFAVGYVGNKLVVSWDKRFDKYFHDVELVKYYKDLEGDNN